jgi:hypothetical protein
LCFECNGGLGQFAENPETMQRAIAYLFLHHPRTKKFRELAVVATRSPADLYRVG